MIETIAKIIDVFSKTNKHNHNSNIKTVRETESNNMNNVFLTFAKKTFVISNSVDQILSSMIRKYLNEQCRRIYSNGDYVIKSHYGNMFREGNMDYAFYRHPDDGCFYKYKKTIIWISNTHRDYDGMTLKYIRGTFNLSSFVKEVREYNRLKITTENKTSYFNNYRIHERIGMSKMIYDHKSGGDPKDGDSSAPDVCGESPSKFYKTDEFLNCTYTDININTQKASPFDSLYYSTQVMDIVADVNEWLKRREWFIERGLPWKRGILLHGPGGTGKSSLVRAMAMHFGLPLNHFYLSSMDDNDFKKAWESSASNTPCIILLEDFDAVFHKRTPVNKDSNLNYDTILNMISGVNDSSGILLVITTNHIEHIDEAMGVTVENKNGISSRPGRIDRVVYMGVMENDQRQKLIHKILRDWPELEKNAFDETTNFTAAQVQEYCIKVALEQLHGK